MPVNALCEKMKNQRKTMRVEIEGEDTVGRERKRVAQMDIKQGQGRKGDPGKAREETWGIQGRGRSRRFH